MFRLADRSSGRRNRAVTLIEAVLYISIALALIVGGLVFFQQASTAAKTSTMVRQLSALLAEARGLALGLPVPDTPLVITDLLISAGAVPPDMVESATELVNPFGGFTEVVFWDLGGGRTALYIVATNVPKAVCAKLLTATSGSGSASGSGGASGTTVVASGYVRGMVRNTGGGGGGSKNYKMNPTQAGWMCKYGSNGYDTQTVEPTGPPLPGNVIVDMVFTTDG
jgi:hypothetical protein